MTYIQSLIQSLVDIYYGMSVEILAVSLIFLSLGLLGIIVPKDKGVTPTFYPIWEKASLSFVIIAISGILSWAGLMPDIEYAYFVVLIFLAIIGFLILYLIPLFIKYKKKYIISIFVNHIKYLQYALYFELFLLTDTNTPWFLVSLHVLVIICMLEAITQIYIRATRQNESKEADRLPESDWPNLELYPSREVQLKKFIPILQQANSEPYAIMISSAWGGGKTSFVKALAADDSFSKDTFIWIEAGSEKSASDIMSNISEQIIDVLKTKNIYLEKAGIIDKYFQAFSGILEETNWKIFNKIGSIFSTDTEIEDTKKYLNRKLDALKSKIYLIVDDLDRCDEEYSAKMFKVIRESTQLTNCKTIFLADRQNFLNENCDNNYIEKYISYHLELCPVAYEEIAHYYFDIIFSDDYISGIRQQIWHGRDSAMLRKELLELPGQIVNTLTKEIDRMNVPLDSMQNAVIIIETDTMNSRKVKNFLKGIKADITNLNITWNDSSVNEYLEEDWISKIIRVQFLKHFFPDYYWEIYSCHRIEKYSGIQAKWVNELLLGVPNTSQPSDGRTEDILNLCIYKLDLLDFEKDKTVEQSCLDELRGASPDISHVEQYIQYATTAEGYSDYQKILKLYHEQNAEISLYQKRILINDLLLKISQIRISDLDAFFRLSKALIDFLQGCSLSGSEIYSCGQRGKEIISNCLECNINALKVPLQAVFGMNYFGTEAADFQPFNFKQFYLLLPHIDGNADDNAISAHDDIGMVQQYYEQLEKQVHGLSYADLYPHIQIDFEKCRLIFNICRLWNDIETTLQPQTNDNAALLKYFSLDQMTYTEDTFQSVGSLKEALNLLEEYYESRRRENQYTSDLSLLFARTVTNLLDLCKTNVTWGIQIRAEAAEVEARIRRIAEIVYKLDQAKTEQSWNVITQIRIMVFTFGRWLREADR